MNKFKIKKVNFLGKRQIPFVGVEIYPRQVLCEAIDTQKEIVVNPSDDSSSSKKGLVLEYEWRVTPNCSQHHEKEASITCLLCGQMFCSSECFKHPGHHKHHLEKKFVYVNWDLLKKNEIANDRFFKSKKFIYCPVKSDVGKKLILTITPKDNNGIICGEKFVHETPKVENVEEKVPISRELISVLDENEENYLSIHKLPTFTVFDYNILAEIYATKSVYPYTEETYLDWNFRKRKILKEIEAGSPDIICLQEVQPAVYSKFLRPELEKLGYISEYKQKTKYVYSKGEYTIDGCAIFLKTSKFSLVSKHEIEFRDLAIRELGTSGKTLLNGDIRRLIKDNISLVLLIKVKSPYYANEPIICVSNVHIMANANCKDIKLWQIHSYLKELEKFSKNGEIPIIMAGDFNSVPNSFAYKLITQGLVTRQELDKTIMEIPDSFNKNIINHLFRNQDIISHGLKFRSSFGRYINMKSEPKYTNKCHSFTGTLDYIFYTDNRFILLKVLRLKNIDNCFLPDRDNPSDHIPLMTEFVLK